MSQQCKPVVIDVERVYVGETSLQAAFEPILELSIRDAAKNGWTVRINLNSAFKISDEYAIIPVAYSVLMIEGV